MRHVGITRRRLMSVLAGAVIAPAPVFSQTTGYLRGAGDDRTFAMANQRTGESINAIYWLEGQYIQASLNRINILFRDWRENAVYEIDTHVIDHLAATQALLDVSEPYLLLSGYRTAKTNRMLSNRIRDVAKRSLHMEGKAADIRLSSRTPSDVRRAAASFDCGGIGHYPGRRFTHIDCGPNRSWTG